MYRSITATVVVVLLAAPAFASGTCSKAPSSQFQPVSALKAKLEATGLTVRRIKVEGGCYESYSVDKNGNQVNTAYNAKTFEAVAKVEAGEG